MSFQELAAALAPLGFKPWLGSTDTLVRRGAPGVYIEQCGWGAPGKAEVMLSGAVLFRGTFAEIDVEMRKRFTTAAGFAAPEAKS